MSKHFTIAVDFDGTLCKDNYPGIGKPQKRTILLVKKIKEKGHTLILYTCRTGKELTDAVEWCKKQGIVFDYVNENDPKRTAHYGSDTRKISADIYIDDRSINPSKSTNIRTIHFFMSCFLGFIRRGKNEKK